MSKPSHILTLPKLHPHAAELRDAILNKLTYSCSTTPSNAGPYDWYLATVLAIRDRMVDRWLESGQRTERRQGKRVYYLSIEFLIGRLLFDSLINLRLLGTVRTALASLDVDLDQLRKLEPDAALGNGGLGRLAACYMDSMAALAVPAYGYGIRYEHGLFMQQIRDGWQHELPERLAGVRQSVGVRAARNRIFDRIRRQRRIYRRRIGRHGARPVVSRPSACSPWRTIRRSPDGGGVTSTRCGFGRRARRRRCISRPSIRATSSAPPPRACRPRPFPACSIRATRRRRDRSCGFARNTSSPRRRCRTSSRRHLQQFDESRFAAGPCRDPAQRHASRDRGRGADAHPGRRARLLMGRRLAHHPRDIELHQSHAVAGGTGELAGGAAQPPAAAAHADHLCDQQAASRRSRRQG